MADSHKIHGRMLLHIIAVFLILAAVFSVLPGSMRTVYAAQTSGESESTGKTGFMKKKDDWYYLVNGKKQKGWIKVGNRTYFGRTKGKDKYTLVKGWLKKGKNWYYFKESGKKGRICSMVYGRTLKINGITCIFNRNGSFRKYKYAGSKKGFVNKIGEMARDNQARNNILASLVTAQACLETGYGRSIHYNNLFGIRSGNGYRHYSSWEKSLQHYTSFMKSFVPWVFGVRNSYRACSIVGSSGYAQAGNYGSMLSTIIINNNLTRFNR